MEHHPPHGPSLHDHITERLNELDARRQHGEHIADDDIDFVIEALRFGISEAITDSLAEGRPLRIDEARLVSSITTGHATGHAREVLERFMTTGLGDPADVRDAVLSVGNPERHSAELHATLDWLSTSLLRTIHPTLTPAPQPLMRGAMLLFPDTPDEQHAWRTLAWCTPERLPTEEYNLIVERLRGLVQRWGEPFRAYLRLPGVDAEDPGLETGFRARFLTTLVDHSALYDHSLPDPIDAVDLSGRIYVFRTAQGLHRLTRDADGDHEAGDA